MNYTVAYWIDIAEYDIVTARAMLQTNRRLYVGFMCHQTIEKALKAAIAKDCSEGEIPPRIHDLSKLAIRAKLHGAMSDEQQDFIEDLNPLNIEARYPEYKQQLLTVLTKDKCEEIIVSAFGNYILPFASLQDIMAHYCKLLQNCGGKELHISLRNPVNTRPASFRRYSS